MATPIERIENAFPNLRTEGYALHSDPDPGYNCLAYAAGDEGRRWGVDTDDYWPAGLPERSDRIANAIAVFVWLGYERCGSEAYETGYERVTIYGFPAPEDTYTHAAKQMPGGRWTSKLGSHEDIVHETITGLVSEEYGEVVAILRRPVLGPF